MNTKTGKLFSCVLLLLMIFSSDVFASSNEVVLEIGSEQITYSKLETAFRKIMNKKNTDLSDVKRDSIDSFIDLYVNYRLKVLDAYDKGYHKDPSMMADIDQNRKILAESYYYNKFLTKKHVDIMLANRYKEYTFAYIIISKANRTGKDSTKIYNDAQNALKDIKGGMDFFDAVRKYSNDLKSVKNEGLISTYVTSGITKLSIENALYTLKAGEYYPEVLDIDYGYLLIKAISVGKRERVLARHILIKPNPSVESAKKTADSLISLINKGASFVELAEENSDAASSASNGGLFPSYYSRSTGFDNNGEKLSKRVEAVLFEMKDMETPRAVSAGDGVHIIRRESTKPIDEEKERKDLKKLYKKQYFDDDKQVLNQKLAKKYELIVQEDVVDQFVGKLNNSRTTLAKDWDKDIDKSFKSKVIYSLFGDDVTVGTLINKMNTITELSGMPLNKRGVDRSINRLTYPLIFEKETKNLEKEFPEFKNLIQEFRDGILLFKVDSEEVWDKLKKFDTVAAKKFWNPRQSQYLTDTLFEISEIFVTSDSLAKAIHKHIRGGMKFTDAAIKYTQSSGMREKKGFVGIVNPKLDFVAMKIVKTAKDKTLLKPFAKNDGYSIVYVHRVVLPRIKTFNEAISDFSPEFQDMMQKKFLNLWLGKLKQKFKIKIHKNTLDKIIAN